MNGQRSPKEVCAQITASKDELIATLDRFRTRSDRNSREAMEEVRSSLQGLKQTFSDYEIVLDGISGEISRDMLAELREIIRALRKITDDWLYELPQWRKG